ncbi:MAG: sigma-70 family RNA polymerase sigma factor [Planctomycetes bacterium]|nr:sigma-70 family RNA polymerase sigma factor [Planctomycetota bacterium]
MTPTDDQLLATVYQRLRGIAERQLRGERDDHTLQPTALVHEAWLTLRDRLEALSHDPARFFAAAAESMRCILIDHARRHNAKKRGGGADRLPLDLEQISATASYDDLIALDEAIAALAEGNPRSAEVVRLRFYAGLTEEEAAQALGMSPRTIRREWAFARAFLFQRLDLHRSR